MPDAYRTVLLLHVLALLVMVAAVVCFAASFGGVRAADSREDAVRWASLAGRTGWLFPVTILGLFASGAYLTHARWTWSTPWIDVSMVALVLVALQGPLVGGPPVKALDVALREHPPGRLDERVRRLARAPALWFVVCGNPAIVAAVVFDMTAKPGAVGAVAAIVIGYAIGAAGALVLRRQPGAISV